jgi:hypothetical protein
VKRLGAWVERGIIGRHLTQFQWDRAKTTFLPLGLGLLAVLLGVWWVLPPEAFLAGYYWTRFTRRIPAAMWQVANNPPPGAPIDPMLNMAGIEHLYLRLTMAKAAELRDYIARHDLEAMAPEDMPPLLLDSIRTILPTEE